MDFSTFLTAGDSLTYKPDPFSGCQEFETSMWATYEDIVQIEIESANDFGEDSLALAVRQFPQAQVHLLSKLIELGAKNARVNWPGSLARTTLPEVEPIEADAAPPQIEQRKVDQRSEARKEEKNAKQT